MNLPDRISRKAIIERDLARLRLRHARTLAPIASGGEPVALIVSLTQFLYQLKLEGMLAKALEVGGYEPAFVVPPRAALPRRFLRAFGARRFVEIDEFVDPGAGDDAREEAARLLEGRTSLRELAALEYHGASVGRYVLSTVSRFLHRGRVDLGDPRTRELLEEILRTAIRSTIAADRLLDALGPDVLLFNERNYAGEAPLSDLALRRGLNVVQFVAALQDDAFVFKRYTAETRRLHPRSLSEDSWRRVRTMPWTDAHEVAVEEEFARRYDGSQQLLRRNQEWTRPMSADDVRRELGLDPAKRTAVIFSHVLWDANMFYGEDLFADQGEWFVESVRAACANDGVQWVVKLHPANVWKRRRDEVEHEELDDLLAVREAIGELPPHVRLLRPDSPVPTRSLFDVTDWGVTIRGSVGFELPCLGIPALTAGTGFYAGLGFTVDSATREEYLARLGRIEDVPPLTPEQVELARRHAYALFRMRPTRFTSFRTVIRPVRDTGHPLDHDLVIRVGSRRELLEADDLHRLARWIRERERLDYLEDA